MYWLWLEFSHLGQCKSPDRFVGGVEVDVT